DDYIKSWEDNQPGDEALDTTKDPCQKVKCSRHKVCVAQGYQRAMCISRKKLEHRIKPLGPKAHGGCKPCHAAPVAAVCGSDGHTYSSACKLEQQACLASKQLTVRCEGQCPCPTPHSPAGDSKQACVWEGCPSRGDLCHGAILAVGLGCLWDVCLRGRGTPQGLGGLETTVGMRAVGHGEAPLGLRGMCVLGDALCGTGRMRTTGMNAVGFWGRTPCGVRGCPPRGGCMPTLRAACGVAAEPPCLRELEKIQIQEATKKNLGTFIPSCDEDGYYRRAQCEPGGGECWCVDQHGAELTGTRGHGSPDCDEATGFSGDFGSSVGWEDEEEKEPEEAGEEGEEEEGEAGEGDDGGY
ncbi:TICN2 protein, partial [Chloropsis hardwickii]|nr:TICN2 protein [Chloropsis hardwickii]